MTGFDDAHESRPADATAELDRRIHAYRPDLADQRLEGKVAARSFVEGKLARITSPVASFHGAPDPLQPRTATKLLGETIRIFEIGGGWAWAQSELDGYVGYVRSGQTSAGGFEETFEPDLETVFVIAPRAPIYLQPSPRARALTWAPMGARLALDAEAVLERGFLQLGGDKTGGWISAQHVRRAETAPPEDWVAEAEKLLHAPYLWGGDSVEGVDCSGLIALARRCAALGAPRDSDLQEQSLGAPLDADAPLERGDLIFWRGHVGVMRDPTTLLHANAYAMAVASEPLERALARIAASEYGEPTSRRRCAPLA